MNFNESIVSKVADSVINNPKVSIAIPAATAAAGKMSEIAQVQSWLTVISMGVGIVVSLIIAVHWIVKTGNALLERKEIQERLNNLIKNHD
jgi:sensor c-di-GMP phosphodiesterase-like protein